MCNRNTLKAKLFNWDIKDDSILDNTSEVKWCMTLNLNSFWTKIIEKGGKNLLEICLAREQDKAQEETEQCPLSTVLEEPKPVNSLCAYLRL